MSDTLEWGRRATFVSAILELSPRLKELEGDFDLTDDELALILAVSPRTVARWYRGVTPEKRALRGLDALWELRIRAWELFSSREQMHGWLHAPSAYLGWLTPGEVLRAGRIDRVRADLDGLAGGIYQ
jgi:hypothetical protein